MEPITSSVEVLVCQTCGDRGFTNAFVYCIKCLGFVIHRYCLDVIPRTSDEFVSWLCEDCKPEVQCQFTLPKLEPSESRKEDAASSAHVKTTHPKKKQKKKKKIAPLVVGKDDVNCPEEAMEPDRECVSVSPTNSPLKEASMKSDLGHNQITPCVAARTEEDVCQKQASEYVQLDDNCSPMKRSTKRKRNATSLAAKTKGNRTRKACTKAVDPIEHSWCDSSCTTVTLKNNESMAQSVEEQRCEIQPSQTGNDKLVSDSSSIEKELNKKTKDYDGQAETANQMHNEQDINASKAGADVSQSVDFENNIQFIHYRSARPVLDPVWRGSFNITQADYDLFEGFVGHLSSKACYKVCEEAAMLPSLLCLEMHPKTALWPKSFLESQPSDENIALYFFPGDTKNERAFDHLVTDMMDEGLAMRATAKNAELLIFTSTVLPQSYWRFQGKYYLWGVFRGKRKDSSTLVNHDLAASNNSGNRGLLENSPDEVTSGKKILGRVKTLDARSPQSPLCNTGERGVDMD